MELGYIGLGKMGRNMVERLVLDFGYRIVAFDRSASALADIANIGAEPANSITEVISALTPPRTVWVMVPADAVQGVAEELVTLLSPKDTVIDGGNSFYKDTIARADLFATKGVHFLDVGVSGGPAGARNGSAIMVGGDEGVFHRYAELFKNLAVPEGYGYMGSSGTGHFVKMVHNGIEYGMMQAIAEGFTTLRASPFALNLKEIVRIYNHGSVIESRLVGWLADAFNMYGEDLSVASHKVAHTGEGGWTVNTAKEFSVETPVMKSAVAFREQSEEKRSYTGQILSALRNQFGGHSIEKEK